MRRVAEQRRNLEYQQDMNFKLRTVIKLLRKQETLNQRIMKLIREMVEYNTIHLELQALTNGLESLKLKAPVLKM